jgi:hypothetical protein
MDGEVCTELEGEWVYEVDKMGREAELLSDGFQFRVGERCLKRGCILLDLNCYLVK